MKNVKEAANARTVLASYHPLWLRLGAEVVVGTAVAGAGIVCDGGGHHMLAWAAGAPCGCTRMHCAHIPRPTPAPAQPAANDSPVPAADLAAFMRDNFFKDPQLARQHPGSGKAYWVALARLVLKRFLLLAALLDRAAQLPTLPPAAPLLFRRESKLKTSVQVRWRVACPLKQHSFWQTRLPGWTPSAGGSALHSTAHVLPPRCSPSLCCRGWRARATWCARWAAWATSCRTCRTRGASWTLRVRHGACEELAGGPTRHSDGLVMRHTRCSLITLLFVSPSSKLHSHPCLCCPLRHED